MNFDTLSSDKKICCLLMQATKAQSPDQPAHLHYCVYCSRISKGKLKQPLAMAVVFLSDLVGKCEDRFYCQATHVIVARV